MNDSSPADVPPDQQAGQWCQEILEFSAGRREILEITSAVDKVVARSGIQSGLCHIFIQHTSASLLLTENADPAVHQDLESFMQRIIPDGLPGYVHNSEGPDDMPAHLRSVITGSSLTIPVVQTRLGLGTWQGIYLWEHRNQGPVRRVVVSVNGLSTGGITS